MKWNDVLLYTLLPISVQPQPYYILHLVELSSLQVKIHFYSLLTEIPLKRCILPNNSWYYRRRYKIRSRHNKMIVQNPFQQGGGGAGAAWYKEQNKQFYCSDPAQLCYEGVSACLATEWPGSLWPPCKTKKASCHSGPISQEPSRRYSILSHSFFMLNRTETRRSKGKIFTAERPL